MLDSSSLRSRVHTAISRVARVSGWQSSLQAQETSLVASVGEAKGRMGLSEEMAAVFEALQLMANERSVGALESLLSAILEDVLPGEGEAKLITGYKANSPHLDILLAKGGNLEDVLDGNGGAVVNVLSTALRYAALVRTKNRRLMVLDEPDCWLKPARVPAFASTIAQVSAQGGIQTFYVTHHDIELLHGAFNIVELFRNEAGKVESALRHRASPDWENDEVPGIREITLINVRTHEHTRIQCPPGATAFIGDNNLGKSTALVSALRALAYGESDDTLISHECEEAKVLVRIENGLTLEMSRHVKRNPTVVFRMYDKEGAVLKEDRAPARGQAPEWLEEALGIVPVDGIDIQLRSQKTPVFLLNESASKRAQILSMGRESGHLRALMKAYEEVKATDRDSIRRGEAELSKVRLHLVFLEPAAGLAESVQSLADRAEPLLAQLGQMERLDTYADKVALLEADVRLLSHEVEVLAGLPEVPTLTDTKDIERVCTQIERTLPVVRGAPDMAEVPGLPALADTLELGRIGRQLATLQTSVAAAEALAQTAPALPATLPEVVDLSALVTKASAISTLVKVIADEEAQLRLNESAEREALADLDALIDSLGGACPLCGSSLSKDHHDHAIH